MSSMKNRSAGGGGGGGGFSEGAFPLEARIGGRYDLRAASSEKARVSGNRGDFFPVLALSSKTGGGSWL